MKKKTTTKRAKPSAVASVASVEMALVLRTCAADMTAHGGFLWPASGPVKAPDWDPSPVCGHGLHGLLWGEGNGQLLSWAPDAKWLVVEVPKSQVIALDGGKVKSPAGVVVHCGDQKSATEYLLARAPADTKCVGATISAANYGTATAGDRGTATAGEGGTISILWWDGSRGKCRRSVACVGEGGIEPHVPYRLDEAGKFVRAEVPRD
jgi:hypothetical protein